MIINKSLNPVSAPFGLTALTALRRALLKNRRLVRKQVLAGNLFGLQVLKIARFVR